MYVKMKMNTAHNFVLPCTSFHRGDKMLKKRELPIGFTMELAQHAELLIRFSHLSEAEQNAIINGAKHVSSREEMREYVKNMFS